MVSIVITLFNKEHCIKRAIDSALNQSHSDCEVVVVDDCSSDNSVKMCQEYGNKIKLIRNKHNVGLPQSRKIGIENVQGEFVTFVDADDYLDADAVKHCVDCQKSRNADIVQMHLTRRITRFKLPMSFKSKYESSKAIDACLYNERLFPVQCCGKLYRTDILQSVRHIEYGNFWGEDRLFNLPILALNPTIAVELSANYNYSWGGATSSQFNIDILQQYKQVYQIKRDWVMANGYEHYSDAMQKELIELLRYYIRQLINSKTMSQPAAESYLNDELAQPFWDNFKQRPNGKELYQSEYHSFSRKMKHCITRLF